MAFRRYTDWKRSLRGLIYLPFPREPATETVDGVFVFEPGADSAVLRLRHHSLPLDGCGHHLQARIGAYRGDRGGGGSVLRAGRFERRYLSQQFWRPNRGGAVDHRCIVLVSADSSLDPGPVGSFLLPRPLGLPANAD